MFNMKEKISIIVPVYNVEKYLERCVESLLLQSYKNIEIILVDDGSTDQCSKICESFVEKNSHIRVIHKENGGLSSARLAGVQVAKGEYILFVDSDDYIAEDMVEKLYNAIVQEHAELAICGYYTKDEEIKKASLLPYKEKMITGRENILYNYILPLIGNIPGEINIPGFLCIRMLKKNLIREEYFVSERKYFMEDHVFDLYYAEKVERIAVVNEPLYFYCINRTSLSNCYRREKWKMYVNLLDFYEQYLEKHEIGKEIKRIEYFIRSAVFATVDNAVLSGTYKAFYKELLLMLEDQQILDLFFLNSSKGMSGMQRIEKSLLKFHMYKTLYYIRKSRLEDIYNS